MSWPRLDARGDGVGDLFQNAIAHAVQRALDLEPRRVLVAAPTVPRGNRTDVDVVLGPHADVNVAVGALLEKDDGLDLVCGERQVDESLGGVVGRSRRVRISSFR